MLSNMMTTPQRDRQHASPLIEGQHFIYLPSGEKLIFSSGIMPFVHAVMPHCPGVSKKKILAAVSQLIADLNQKISNPQKLAQDFNPDHFPKSSGKAGQFAPKKGGNYSAAPIHEKIHDFLSQEMQDFSNARHSLQQTFSIPKTKEEWQEAFEKIPELLDGLSAAFPETKAASHLAAAMLAGSLKKTEKLASHLGENEKKAAYLFEYDGAHTARAIAHEFKEGSAEWLHSHENINGSHTIAKHVGQTLGDMKRRLKFEPRVEATGTFPDIETAARTIAKAIRENRQFIQQSLAKGKKSIKFPFEDKDFIGTVLKQGEKQVSKTKKIQVILHPDSTKRGGYIIHTAYPIL